MTLTAQVELCPVTVPVERYSTGCLVLGVDLLEGVEIDQSRAWICEEAKRDLVLRIRLLQEVIEDVPVPQCNSGLALAIGNLKEKPILFALDFMLEEIVSATVIVPLRHDTRVHAPTMGNIELIPAQ